MSIEVRFVKEKRTEERDWREKSVPEDRRETGAVRAYSYEVSASASAKVHCPNPHGSDNPGRDTGSETKGESIVKGIYTDKNSTAEMQSIIHQRSTHGLKSWSHGMASHGAPLHDASGRA